MTEAVLSRCKTLLQRWEALLVVCDRFLYLSHGLPLVYEADLHVSELLLSVSNLLLLVRNTLLFPERPAPPRE